MNKRRAAFYAVITILLGILLYLGHPEATPEGSLAERETAAWVHEIAARAHQGYWLVVRGTHPGDQVVAAASAARLTHAAVLDKDHNQIIEAVGPGVRATPLLDLLAESVRLQIVRPRGYTPEKGASAVARARSHVGSGYDWLGTVGIQNNAAYYCTELCADAYHAREEGWMPRLVLHPETLANYGELVFDSGMRASRHAL